MFGAMVASQANASLVYAAKFVCGNVLFEAGINEKPGEIDAVIGVYLTSINIHNPQNHPVSFFKAIRPAHEEGQPKIPGTGHTETLDLFDAEFVSCNVIYKSLNITPGTHIKGFVELTVNENVQTGAFDFLDVVGKYTARSPNIGTYSPALNIVVYYPTIIQD